MNTRPGAASSTTAARFALTISLGALVAMLTACGSTSSAPVRQRNLVVANPVSVSPGLATSATARAQPDPDYPRRRPGAIVRAPRPGDDLSAPPKDKAPPATPQRAADNQIQSTIKVAAADQPKASPPPQPKPEPQPDPKPDVAPTPQPTPQPAAPGEWWTQTPANAPGRIRIVASGVGSNLREAREAAVESGLAKLRATLGADPQQVTYERTTVQPEGSGVLRGFVLVSCNDAP